MTTLPPNQARTLPATHTINLSAREQECFAYMRLHCTPNLGYKLNLADDLQWEFAFNNLKRAGESPEIAPQTYRALESAREAALKKQTPGPPDLAEAYQPDTSFETVVPLNAIIQFNRQNRKDNARKLVYQTTALSTVPGGTNKTTILLNLVDLRDESISSLTTQATTWPQEGANFQTSLTLEIPASDNPKILANATFYLYESGSPIPTIYFMTMMDSENATAGCMTAPTYKQYQGKDVCTNKVAHNEEPIVACRFRAGDGCDYIDTPADPSGGFGFPVTGHTTYASEVLRLPRTGKPAGGFLLFLQPRTGGAAILANNINSQQRALEGFTVSGNQVQWDLPQNSQPIFEGVGKNTDTTFNMFLSVMLDNGNTANCTFSSDRRLSDLRGVFTVPGVFLR